MRVKPHFVNDFSFRTDKDLVVPRSVRLPPLLSNIHDALQGCRIPLARPVFPDHGQGPGEGMSYVALSMFFPVGMRPRVTAYRYLSRSVSFVDPEDQGGVLGPHFLLSATHTPPTSSPRLPQWVCVPCLGLCRCWPEAPTAASFRGGTSTCCLVAPRVTLLLTQTI